jgi:hypothetical protein
MILTHPVTADLKVYADTAPPALSPSVQDRVQQIWEVEKAKRGDGLYNGRLFSVDKLSPMAITGWFAEYGWFLAQRRDPSLRANLHVNPLGVTGILRCSDGVVVGRRAANVEMDAGLWELVPSGGVDGSATTPNGEIDLGGHVLSELSEEIGLDSTDVVARPVPILAVEDRTSLVTDVALLIEVAMSGAQVKSIHGQRTNREYLEIQVIPMDGLVRYHEIFGRRLAEVSQKILSHLGPMLSMGFP